MDLDADLTDVTCSVLTGMPMLTVIGPFPLRASENKSSVTKDFITNGLGVAMQSAGNVRDSLMLRQECLNLNSFAKVKVVIARHSSSFRPDSTYLTIYSYV